MKAYLAQRLITHIGTNAGIEIRARSEADGCLGVMPVFKTKTAARKCYGRGVELREVLIPLKVDRDQ